MNGSLASPVGNQGGDGTRVLTAEMRPQLVTGCKANHSLPQRSWGLGQC